MAPHNKAAAQKNRSQEAHVKAVLARANLERDKRVLALENSIHLLIKIYLNEWKEAMDTVITDAKSPEEEKSRFYWFVALAGNVLWAATCLVPTGGALVAAGAAAVEAAARAQRAVKVMSFGGAIIGSGTVEQIYGNRGNTSANLKIQIGTAIQQFAATGDPAADGKSIARLVLAAKRDELEDLFKSQEKQWALDVNDAGEGGFDVKEVMDTFVWRQLFPRIPYKGKQQAMYQSGLTSVNGALGDYNKQWKDWKFRKDRSQPHWKNRRMNGEYWDYSVPDPGDFKPQLKFDLLT